MIQAQPTELIAGLPFAEYTKLPGVRQSGVKCFAVEGPLMYHAKYVTREVPDSESDAMRLGRAFHLSMENPDAWRECVYIIPTELKDDAFLETVVRNWKDRSTKAELTPGTPINLQMKPHREYAERHKLEAEDQGRDYVTQEDANKIGCMVASVWENPKAREYLGLKGQYEVTGRREHESGLTMNSRADWLPEADITLDFKTTRQSVASAFAADARRAGYHFQGAFYMRVFDRKKHVVISVRNEPPFESLVYRITEGDIEFAMDRNDREIGKIAQCYAMDSWHSIGWGEEIPLQ